MMNKLLCLGIGLSFGLVGIQEGLALPPPEDIPEEVLRNEIILEARSPLDGELLTAAEYAELEEKLSQPQAFIDLDPNLEQLILLLHIRKTINTLIPFANF
ncbi:MULTISPECIES: hypothetical protein [Spirulina sp. CCY15215]|uniref:hypothetical protein n=1 Tax=Spirulina sp. CCY15215 TaxID=2767591 RepID=UPI00194FBF99|nr:hypothetical protein [Spirulina major]